MKSLIITWITLLLLYKTYTYLARAAIRSIEREKEDEELLRKERTDRQREL